MFWQAMSTGHDVKCGEKKQDRKGGRGGTCKYRGVEGGVRSDNKGFASKSGVDAHHLFAAVGLALARVRFIEHRNFARHHGEQ